MRAVPITRRILPGDFTGFRLSASFPEKSKNIHLLPYFVLFWPVPVPGLPIPCGLAAPGGQPGFAEPGFFSLELLEPPAPLSLLISCPIAFSRMNDDCV